MLLPLLMNNMLATAGIPVSDEIFPIYQKVTIGDSIAIPTRITGSISASVVITGDKKVRL